MSDAPTPAATDELIERLRARADRNTALPILSREMHEAADALVAAQAKIKELEGELEKMQQRWENEIAEIGERS